jgi:hypothetical protein
MLIKLHGRCSLNCLLGGSWGERSRMTLPCGITVCAVYLAYKAHKNLIRMLLFSLLFPSLHASPFSLSSSLQRQSQPQEVALPILQAQEGDCDI